jgi:hypothetical protein
MEHDPKNLNGKHSQSAIHINQLSSDKAAGDGQSASNLGGEVAPAARPKVKVKPVQQGELPPANSGDPLRTPPVAAAGKSSPGQAARSLSDDDPVKPELNSKRPPRPFFMPDDCEFESLPQGIQQAISEFVTPCSEQAIGEVDPLKKSVGLTMTFELALEIVSQSQVMSAVLDPSTDPAELERRLSLHDRNVKRKQKSEDLLLRLRAQEYRERGQGLLRRPR